MGPVGLMSMFRPEMVRDHPEIWPWTIHSYEDGLKPSLQIVLNHPSLETNGQYVQAKISIQRRYGLRPSEMMVLEKWMVSNHIYGWSQTFRHTAWIEPQRFFIFFRSIYFGKIMQMVWDHPRTGTILMLCGWWEA